MERKDQKTEVQETVGAEGAGEVFEVPANKVISLADAQKHLNAAQEQAVPKLTAKERKAQKQQEEYMRSYLPRGEFHRQLNEFATSVSNTLDQIFPRLLMNQNGVEILIETLIRKGIITMDFLNEVQSDMIERAKAQAEAQATAAQTTEEHTEAHGHDKAHTTHKGDKTHD